VTLRYIKIFESLVHITIAQENTTSQSNLEFFRVIGAEIGPTCTPEGTKRRRIWGRPKKSM
jgi:hypothetical protein